MYQALAKSLNLPAVATVKELGIDKAFEAGEKFGLDMSDVDRVLGVALGGGVETNPLQMAQAYAVFAMKDSCRMLTLSPVLKMLVVK